MTDTENQKNIRYKARRDEKEAYRRWKEIKVYKKI
jgi:hypothetical protein